MSLGALKAGPIASEGLKWAVVASRHSPGLQFPWLLSKVSQVAVQQWHQ